MKSRRSVDTELLYRGNHIPGIAELPDTPPIYHATAYAVKDTDDYDRANRGEKYFYNRTANPNRDCLGEIISYLEYGENTIICSSGICADIKKGIHHASNARCIPFCESICRF